MGNKYLVIMLSIMVVVTSTLAAIMRTSKSTQDVSESKKLCERGQTWHVSGSTGLLDCYRWRNDYLMVEEDKVRGEISEMQKSLDTLSYERHYTRELIDMVKCDKLQHNDYCLGK